METRIALFQKKEIRKTLHENEWWFVVVDVVAVQGQAEDGARQGPAGFIDRQQFLTMQQLAAWHAVGVEDEQLDHFDVGVGVQEILGFLHGSEFHFCSRIAPWGALMSCLAAQGARGHRQASMATATSSRGASVLRSA